MAFNKKIILDQKPETKDHKKLIQSIQDRYKVTITKKLEENRINTSFIAQSDTDDERYIIKILKNENTSTRIEDRIRFRNQVEIIHNIDHPNIQKILGGDTLQNTSFTISKYTHGSSLYKLAAQIEESQHPAQILKIILAVCQGLSVAHARKVNHLDLRPSNIIIPIEEKKAHIDQLQLINFGISQLKEYTQVTPGEIIETFGYIAPEQTGHIQKSKPDERSDIYALGIILYELLAKKHPFDTSNIEVLLHQHVARVPSPPSTSNKQISQIIDRIALKMLEKDPAARYQSVAGLIADIEKVLAKQNDFVLGLEDGQIRLDYHTPLVGREEESAILKASLTQAQSGKGSIILVGAVSGQGKTRLIDEIRIDATNPCIGGKFFSGETKSPYLPFKEAISAYVTRFSKYEPEKQSTIRETWLASVGDLGQLLLRFNPELKVILGSQHPEIPALDTPEKENSRYISTLANLFTTLATAENGLVLILDDLQWADAGSMNLLQRLTQELFASNLLILGTYRNNEIAEDHALTQFINNNAEKGAALKNISLKPFDLQKLIQMTEKLLHASVKTNPDIEDIAKFILAKGRGNPFFSIEILKQLERTKEKPLVYQDNHWAFKAAIAANLDIAETSIDIVLKEIAKLPANEIEVLSIAALVGHKFKTDLLFKLIDTDKISRIEIVAIIDHGIELQLIEKDPEGQILFVHDRIREAFYARLNERDRKLLHTKIAETLDRELNDKEKQEMLFDMAHHFIKAENAEKIIEYVLPAAEKAKELYANDEALKYYKVILAHSNEQALRSVCLKNMGELYLNKGDYTEAIKTLNLLLEYKHSLYEKAEISKLLCDAYHHNGDFAQSEFFGKTGLSYLNEKLPIGGIPLITGTAREMLNHFLRDVLLQHNTKDIRNKYTKKEEQSRNKLIVGFYISLAWSYAYTNALKAIRANSRMLNVSTKRIGPSIELAIAMGAVAGPYMILGLFDLALKFLNKSISMHAQFNNSRGMGQTHNLSGYTYEWDGQFEKAIESFSIAREHFIKVGDYREEVTSISGLIHANYCLANYTEENQLRQKHFELVSKSNDIYGICDAYITNLCYFHETGNLKEALRWAEESLALSIKNEKQYNLCTTYMEYGYLLLDGFGKTEKAEELLTKAKELYDKNDFLKNYSVNIFNYIAELQIQKANTDKNNKQTVIELERACTTAIKQTKGWKTHYGAALRNLARYYAISGKTALADKYFEQSIEHCGKIGRRFEQGKSLYEYGLYQESLGQKDAAKKNLEQAYTLFTEIGSLLYRRRAADKLGIRPEEKQQNEQLVEAMQIKGLIEMLTDINSTKNMDELLPKVMDLAIKTTGAARGYLFLYDEQEKSLVLKARSSVSTEETTRFPSGVIDKVFHSGQPLLSADAVNDPELRELTGITNSTIHSMLCIPVKMNATGQTIGVCYVDNPSIGYFEGKEALLSTFMSSSSVSLENLFNAEKQTRIITRSKQMMNAEMVDWIVLQDKEPKDHHAISSNRSILFTDIRSFTDIAEEIGDPEKLTNFLNVYMETIAQPLHHYEDQGLADTDKFIGDAMMYIFTDPETSLHAAIEMRKQLYLFNTERAKLFENIPPYIKPIDMGIGIAQGPVMLGLTGHSRRKQFTALGDTVNTGARIESLTKIYHAPILINDALYAAIDPAGFNLRMLDIIRPKGKSNAIKIYEEFSSNSPAIRDLKIETLPSFQELQALYYSKDFANALKVAKALIHRFAETVARYNLGTDKPGDHMPYVYIERIQHLQELSPVEIEAWDGAYAFTEK